MLGALAIPPLRDSYKTNNALAGGTALGNVLNLVNHFLPGVLATTANIPAGADQAPVMANPGTATHKVPTKVLQLHQGAVLGQVLVTLHGEQHWEDTWKGKPPGQVFKPDMERGQSMIQELVTGGVNPALIVMESGLGQKYNLSGFANTIVREEALVNAGTLGIPERSRFVAGFVFLCLVGGDQAVTDQVLMFFGGEHADILDGIEYFAKHSGASWFQKRQRSYAVIRSLAGK
jgi:hypothetical protein